MNEEWRLILEYNEIYEVSNLGNVRSRERDIHRVTGAVEHRDAKCIKIHYDQKYPYVCLYDGKKYYNTRVDMLVATYFLNCTSARSIHHIDGDMNNCKLNNLQLDKDFTLDNEVWKDIPELHGYYQISNLGRLKACERWIHYSDGRKRFRDESILSPTINSGYYRCQIKYNGVDFCEFVHRLVAQAFIPNPENKKDVNHKNGNKLDNRVENLEWCTRQENRQHALYTGLDTVAVRVHCVEDNLDFCSMNEAAAYYHVDDSTIRRHISEDGSPMHTLRLSKTFTIIDKPLANDTSVSNAMSRDIRSQILANPAKLKDIRMKNKPVSVMCIETGEVFQSYTECSRYFDIDIYQIRQSCDRGYAVKGYHFKRLEDKDDNCNIHIIPLDGEIWVDIPGFEDSYRISNFGRVCSKERICNTSNPVVGTSIRIVPEKLLTVFENHVALSKNNKRVNLNVARTVNQVFKSLNNM